MNKNQQQMQDEKLRIEEQRKMDSVNHLKKLRVKPKCS